MVAIMDYQDKKIFY